jgi:hypothetical protein
MKSFPTLFVACALSLSVNLARADDESFTLTLKDHKFSPTTLEIPAGKKVKLIIKNLDGAAEEFESDDLHREKVIPAGKQGVVSIGPLKPGSYSFKGEFNPKTAIGTIVVK